jgi:hypothetical protein
MIFDFKERRKPSLVKNHLIVMDSLSVGVVVDLPDVVFFKRLNFGACNALILFDLQRLLLSVLVELLVLGILVVPVDVLRRLECHQLLQV